MAETKLLSEADVRSSYFVPYFSKDVVYVGGEGAWVLYRSKTTKEIYVYVSDYHAAPTLVLTESGLEKLLLELKTNK